MSQPPTGPITSQTDASSNESEQASIGNFRPVVPLWFLDNVGTFDELQELDTCLEFVNNALPNKLDIEAPLDEKGKTINDHFGIDRLTIEDVLDMTAALHITIMPAASECGIVLLSKMRFGCDFLDRFVVTMAREVRSSIITLTASELEDIALDFLRQRNLYIKGHSEHNFGDESCTTNMISDVAEYFFGSQSRRKASKSHTDRNEKAVLALLDAVTVRIKVGQSLITEVDNPGIIFYFRDMSFDWTTLQRRILCRFRDTIFQRR